MDKDFDCRRMYRLYNSKCLLNTVNLNQCDIIKAFLIVHNCSMKARDYI